MSSVSEIEIIHRGGLTIDEYNMLIDLRHDFYEYEKDNITTTDIDPYVRLLQNKYIDPISIIDLYTGYLICRFQEDGLSQDTLAFKTVWTDLVEKLLDESDNQNHINISSQLINGKFHYKVERLQ
jgi:hypothetical protein